MKTNTPPKTILCIHDLSSLGRSSLSVVLPVLAALGHQPVALPTALLSTHTGGLGIPAVLHTDGYTPDVLEHYRQQGVEFDCIYSGYLASVGQAELVRRAFELWPNAFKLVDPVMGDNGKLYSGITPDFCRVMKELCGLADLIVPNFTEACLLLGQDMPESLTASDALTMAQRLAETYPSVVVTGLPLEKNLGNAGAEKGKPPFLVQRLKIGRSFPGTGDLFGAVLTGALIKGNALSAAVDAAAGFVADCIAATPADADRRFGVWLEPQLFRLLGQSHEL